MRSPALRASGAVLPGAAAIALHACLYGAWVVDDAAITFAYARSLASGDGLVLQPGQPPVEAYSNPTWLALLALGRLAGLFDHGTIFGIADQVLFPKALAFLCCVGILVAMYRAASAVTRRPAVVTLVAGLTLATIPSFVIWCFSGLENSLFALAVAWLAAVLCRASVQGRLGTATVSDVRSASSATVSDVRSASSATVSDVRSASSATVQAPRLCPMFAPQAPRLCPMFAPQAPRKWRC